MAGQNEQNKYIKCKGCKCKYINDEEHIKQDFGYNRLGEQLKSCVNAGIKTNMVKIKRNNKVLILM